MIKKLIGKLLFNVFPKYTTGCIEKKNCYSCREMKDTTRIQLYHWLLCHFPNSTSLQWRASSKFKTMHVLMECENTGYDTQIKKKTWGSILRGDHLWQPFLALRFLNNSDHTVWNWRKRTCSVILLSNPGTPNVCAIGRYRTSGQLFLVSGSNISPKSCCLVDTPRNTHCPCNTAAVQTASLHCQGLTFIHSSALSKPTSMLMMSNPEVDLFFWWTPRINAHKVCKEEKQKVRHTATPPTQ